MALESNVAVSEDLLDEGSCKAIEANGRLVLLRTEQDGRVAGIVLLRLRRVSAERGHSLIELSDGLRHGSKTAVGIAKDLLDEACYWFGDAGLRLGQIQPGKLIKQPPADRLNLDGEQASSQGTVTISHFLFS